MEETVKIAAFLLSLIIFFLILWGAWRTAKWLGRKWLLP